MNLFLIFAVLSIWLLVSAWKPQLRSRRISLGVLLAILAVLLFDFRPGVDSGSYIWLYKSILLNEIDYRNMGYVYLIRIIQLFTDRYVFSVLVVNIINIVLCFRVVIRYSRNYIFSLFLFLTSGIFLMYYSSGVRQMLAMAVFLFSFYEYLPKKKWVLYYMCCVVSFMFHEAGIISFFVPAVFLYQKLYQNSPRNTLIGTGAGIFAIFMLISFIIPWIVTNYWWVPVISHFIRYVENTSISVMGLGMECVWFCVVLFLFLQGNREKQTDWDQFQMLVWGFAFAVYLCMVKYPQTSRICDYLQVIMLVFVPNLVEGITKPKKRVLSLVPVLGLSLILLYGDMAFCVPKMQSNYPALQVTMMRYPYISVFAEEKIDLYYGKYFK